MLSDLVRINYKHLQKCTWTTLGTRGDETVSVIVSAGRIVVHLWMAHWNAIPFRFPTHGKKMNYYYCPQSQPLSTRLAFSWFFLTYIFALSQKDHFNRRQFNPSKQESLCAINDVMVCSTDVHRNWWQWSSMGPTLHLRSSLLQDQQDAVCVSTPENKIL